MSREAEQEMERPRAHVITWFRIDRPVEGAVFVRPGTDEASESGDQGSETR